MSEQLVATQYKQSEVGLIPADWNVVRIGELLKIRHGKSQKEVESDLGKYPILGTGGLMGFATKYLYNGESVLIGRKGTIDKPQYMNTPFWTVDTLFYSEIVKGVIPKMIYYNFKLIDWYSYNEASGVPSLNASTIENIKIPFPPTLHEQQAISQVLSDTDKLMQSLEKKIAKKKLIKQGVMQQLLTPKEGWEVKKLGELATFLKGKGMPKSNLTNGGIYKCIHYGELFTTYNEQIGEIISSSNIYEGTLSVKNDVLMPTSDVTPNGLATASCILSDGVLLGGDVLIIRIPQDILYGTFLSYYVTANKSRVMELVSGSTVYHLYGSDMSKFEVSYPSKALQFEIADKLEALKQEITILNTKLIKLNCIKQGMMQQLLTGKIRLV